MLLPAVSVTIIGLIAGLIFIIVEKKRLGRTRLRSIAGTWIGFIMGTIFGVIVDVMTQVGTFK